MLFFDYVKSKNYFNLMFIKMKRNQVMKMSQNGKMQTGSRYYMVTTNGK